MESAVADRRYNKQLTAAVIASGYSDRCLRVKLPAVDFGVTIAAGFG